MHQYDIKICHYNMAVFAVFLLLFVNYIEASQCYIVQHKHCKNAIKQVTKSLQWNFSKSHTIILVL